MRIKDKNRKRCHSGRKDKGDRMIKSYLEVAIRNILRHKGHSFIKIFSLSIGIAACVMIYLFVVDELSFDRFHENADRLFRVVQITYDKNTGKETAYQQYMPTPVGPELQKLFPEIEHQTRYVSGTGVVRYEEKIFQETLDLVDSPFFEMFSFPLIYGDPETVLSDNHHIVLSRSCAKKYFGHADPRGKTLSIAFGQVNQDFTVTGVAEDVPFHSSLQFDIVIPFDNLPIVFNNPDILSDWHRWFCPFFIQIQPNVKEEQLKGILEQFCQQYYSVENKRYIDEGDDPFKFGLQPVKNIHLDSRFAGTAGLSASYLLSAIAFIILLIACVNFMNLSVGSSSIRSTEVGVRKVIGAERRQIMQQFLGEALLMSFFAVILGLVFIELLLPQFNALSGKQLSLTTAFRGIHVLALLMIAVLSGILAGSYPAVIMSAFRPVDIIKGKLKVGGRRTLTKGLVVFQFALSVVLVISAIILGRQLLFMVNRDPGYMSDGLVVVLTQENAQQESERIYERYRNEVISQSRIHGVTASNREFGIFLPSTNLELGAREIHYRFNRVDRHFLSTMKFELTKGRDFSPNVAADSDAVIVNERFLEELGSNYRMGETLGDVTKGFPYNCRVVGVIKDCHFLSLRTEIEPLLLYVGKGESPNRDRFSRVIIRIETGQIKETLGLLERAWKKIQPNKPFTYYFQKDALKSLYDQEKRWSSVVQYASLVSMLLACLGIFSLTAMSLSRREKEIGIRKVLGASVGQIIYLGLKEFILLISIANVIAWPIVYLVMKKVLQNYPYRVDIAPQYFLLAGMASILVAVMTILYLSVRAALQNPVDSLHYE
jgi:putative ABC transport system permease protein